MRFVGLSTALANAKDVADWLGVEPIGLFNFKPSVRECQCTKDFATFLSAVLVAAALVTGPVPMNAHIQGFPGKHYCPRMASMNKPAYAVRLPQLFFGSHPAIIAKLFVFLRRR